MPRENPIGEYLRARRELVRPEDVELPDAGSHRRGPGLRREEVAMLAGVSADYYVRLEQGRDQQPSPPTPRSPHRPPPRARGPTIAPRAREPAPGEGARQHLAADRVVERDTRL